MANHIKAEGFQSTVELSIVADEPLSDAQVRAAFVSPCFVVVTRWRGDRALEEKRLWIRTAKVTAHG